MAEQSLLAKLGMRLGQLGSAASLAIAFPLANGNYDTASHTATNRTGFYGSMAVGSEAVGIVAGGATGPTFTHTSTVVQLGLNASVAGGAPFNIPQGAAVTAPNNGDWWTTNAGAFVRIQGVTYTLTAPGGAGIGGSITAGQVAYGAATANTIAGDSGMTYTSPGQLTLSTGAITASAAALTVNQTWNNSGVSFVATLINVTNTASTPITSYPLQIIVSGTSQFTVNTFGTVSFNGNLNGPANFFQVVGATGATTTGPASITPQVVSTGAQVALTVTTAANTGQTASTEVHGINFNTSATRTWATGNFATQRETLFQAPTYAFAGASTITTAATVAISDAPAAGTNVTLTNAYALWVQAGLSFFTGAIIAGAGNGISFVGAATAFTQFSNTQPQIYRAQSGGTFPFNTNGGLVLQTPSAANAGIFFAAGTSVAVVAQIGGPNPAANTMPTPVIYGRNNAAADVAGAIGESITGTASAVALASTTQPGTITSVVLTAGKWLLRAWAVVDAGATGLTANSTVQMSIVTITNTNGTEGTTMTQESVLALLANGKFALTISGIVVNISAGATYFLTVQAAYVAGSPTASGLLIAERQA